MKITSENYVESVLVTESPVNQDIINRLINPDTIRLLHGSLGLVTEAAELADMLKKHIFYGKALDFPNAKEEIGDSMWYVGLIIDVLNTTFNEVLTINIAKLAKRYPEKFTEYAAINRDLEAERKILEG